MESKAVLGAIHIIPDTFLAYFRPPPNVLFGETGADQAPTPTPV